MLRRIWSSLVHRTLPLKGSSVALQKSSSIPSPSQYSTLLHSGAYLHSKPPTQQFILNVNPDIAQAMALPVSLLAFTIILLWRWKRRWKVLPHVPFSAVSMIGEIDMAMELNCPHFAECPGCKVERNYLSTPLAVEAQHFFSAYCPSPVELYLGPVHNWRTVVKLAVRAVPGSGASCAIGLFKERSHDILRIPQCQVQHPSINAATVVLEEVLDRLQIVPYNEQTCNGMLRYVLLNVERHSGQLQLTFVWNAQSLQQANSDGLLRLVDHLMNTDPAQQSYQGQTLPLKSIWVNLNVSQGNNIVDFAPSAWYHIAGDRCLQETVGAASFLFPPTIFRQANLDAFEQIIEQVAAAVPEGSRVCELYSGIGIIGVNVLLRRNAQWVHCSDDNPNLVDSFDAAVRLLPTTLQQSIRFKAMAAVDALKAGEAEGASVLIVDPPRKGLSAEEIQLLSNSTALPTLEKIIYVSCGFKALKRDTQLLVESGFWTVESVKAHLLFPGTDHIETVVIFRRKLKAHADSDADAPMQLHTMPGSDSGEQSRKKKRKPYFRGSKPPSHRK